MTVPTPNARIAAAFEKARAENRAALMPFLTAGYPTIEASRDWLMAIVAGGADLIEIGIPFSDPLADGTTVQRTSQVALENGAGLTTAFEMVEYARANGVEIPIVFMGYVNPFFQFGIESLATEAQRVGVDGFIIADLPIEESDDFRVPLAAGGADLIYMVAPTTTDRRISEVAQRASGFIYCVSLTGVTGARASLADNLSEYIGRVRTQIDIPLAIGFGISTPDHVQQAAAIGDGVVVASAMINYLDTLPSNEQPAAATRFVRELADAAAKPGA
ncbi:MAG: tryptophan synthase subunit alpha [Thermomicrobiales bacterium]|nr:tryptophan synthase subunit alpha [Thermomicrobiales bacterium]MCO5223637.1 tryptophan synthase subunit alpha [Thermomicrobiales bacterium]